MSTSSRNLKQIAYLQLKEFLLIAVYLWVVFGLLVMFKSVVLAEHHIAFAYHGFALINALALAKVMLVAKDLHLGEMSDVLIPFIGFGELQRVLGPGRLAQLFLHPRPPMPA